MVLDGEIVTGEGDVHAGWLYAARQLAPSISDADFMAIGTNPKLGMHNLEGAIFSIAARLPIGEDQDGVINNIAIGVIERECGFIAYEYTVGYLCFVWLG